MIILFEEAEAEFEAVMNKIDSGDDRFEAWYDHNYNHYKGGDIYISINFVRENINSINNCGDDIWYSFLRALMSKYMWGDKIVEKYINEFRDFLDGAGLSYYIDHNTKYVTSDNYREFYNLNNTVA